MLGEILHFFMVGQREKAPLVENHSHVETGFLAGGVPFWATWALGGRLGGRISGKIYLWFQRVGRIGRIGRYKLSLAAPQHSTTPLSIYNLLLKENSALFALFAQDIDIKGKLEK